jgi:hypothetical protein
MSRLNLKQRVSSAIALGWLSIVILVLFQNCSQGFKANDQAFNTNATSLPSNATVSITATPSTILTGQSSTLTWSSTSATGCIASGAWSGSEATSGTLVVKPTATSTYSLFCTDASGTAAQSVTITVSQSMPPAPLGFISLPQGVAGFSGIAGNIINRIVVVENIIYLSTNGGLSISTDGGYTFTTSTTANGLGSNQVNDLSVVGTWIYKSASGFCYGNSSLCWHIKRFIGLV